MSAKKEKSIEERAAEFKANEDKHYAERMRLAARTEKEAAAAEAADKNEPRSAEGEGKG